MANMDLTSMEITSGPGDLLPLSIRLCSTSLASGTGTQTPPLTIEMVIRGRRIPLGGKRPWSRPPLQNSLCFAIQSINHARPCGTTRGRCASSIFVNDYQRFRRGPTEAGSRGPRRAWWQNWKLSRQSVRSHCDECRRWVRWKRGFVLR